MTNLSNKELDMMLELLTKVLPKGNLVPRLTYEAKKILRDLGMSYEPIYACKNDCALFLKENENLDTSRWYENDPFILPSQAKQVFYL